MKEAQLKVTLLSHTENPEELIYSAFRQCYNKGYAGDMFKELCYEEEDHTFRKCKGSIESLSLEEEHAEAKYYKDREKRHKLITEVLESGHQSPIEHVSFTFAIEGISRSTANQLVRHRLASHSQISQRYCNGEDFEYICPPHIAKNPVAKQAMLDCFNTIQNSYKIIQEELIKEGHKKYANEEARCVLPQAAETKIVVTMNCRSLWNFFNERCCNRAQYEIRMMAKEMLKQCRGVLPIIFDVAGAKCEALKYCPEAEKFCCGKYPTLNKLKTSEIEWSMFKTTWKPSEIAKAITSTIPNSIAQIAKEIGNIKDKFKK